MGSKLLNLWVAVCALLLALGTPRSAGAGEVVGPDIVPTSIEVTQSVQDIANNVTLIAGKNTYVRFHVRGTTGSFSGVSARLIGVRLDPPNTPISLGTVTALNAPLTVKPAPLRVAVNDSFLFQVPLAWRSGSVQLVATADPDNLISESDETNNTLTEFVQFTVAPPMRLVFHSVNYPGGSPPTATDINKTKSWLLRAFPIRTLLFKHRVINSPIEFPDDVCNCPKNMAGGCMAGGVCANDPSYPCSEDVHCGCSRLNSMLMAGRIVEALFSPSTYEPDARYYAMVSDSGGFMRGCSPGLWAQVASGPTGSDTWGWDTDGSYGDWYTAHELAHAYDRPHATCCGAAGNTFFPHPMCSIGSQPFGHYGFDTLDRSVLAPGIWRDVMSYCNFQWTSDFTFETLLDRLELEAGEPAPRTVRAAGIFVQATLNLSLNHGVLNDVYRLQRSFEDTVSTPGAEFSIQQFDAAGALLSSFAFDVTESFNDSDLIPPEVAPRGGDHRIARIAQVIPLAPGNVAGISLVRNGTLLDTRFASSNPPTVTMRFPNGGEVLTRGPTVRWDAADADGDSLTATLLYSTNDGLDWTMVATDIRGDSHNADLSGLPGGAAVLFRVLVSDGFHTADDSSDRGAEVPDSPPDLALLEPQDGAQLAPDHAVVFEALAQDPEDGPLNGVSLQWTSDLQGALGEGASLEVSSLLLGDHGITVVATDSNGNEAEASIQLSVVPPPVEVPTLPWLAPVALALGALGVLLGRARRARPWR